ncbi:complement component 1 Q subcomponent-binding protein, mitochondrial [Chironomus tepperi]|uniref:complement component 1 Q subcomponent-binding protein, mitochondrial n=1 Tax=Chironomus tepperi TaxID=113505 RepID=UPI00391F817E
MNSILRTSVRSIRSLVTLPKITKTIQNRSIYHMVVSRNNFASNTAITLTNPSINCKCGCGGMSKMHTKGERELVEFLAEEIIAEQKAQKKKTLPTEIDGFKVKLDGADVELVKDLGKETITISFNVNHTVDAEEEPEIAPEKDNVEFGEMKSKPTFEIDIKKANGKTLSISCSFLQGEAQEGEYNDVFGIDELTIFDGEWTEKTYAVAGDVLDGYLYDLLMNFLEEKGISNEFAEKIIEFSTAYEHHQYISLLEGLSKFAIDTK